MVRLTRPLLTISALACAALLVGTGCQMATGGGWGESDTHAGQTTFTVSLRCDQTSSLVTGDLAYHDRPAQVSIHGTLTPIGVTTLTHGEAATCADLDRIGGQITPPLPTTRDPFSGQYVSDTLGTGQTGLFTVTAYAGTLVGCAQGDAFALTLHGGSYDEYSAAVCLDGRTSTEVGS